MKTVLKTTPVSLYDIQGLERWLEERANEGLFPVLVNADFTQFRRDESIRGARFRLEAANGQELVEPERLELYRQAGWDYEGRVGKLYFLFSTGDPSAPELHTDPVTKGISLEWLSEQVRKARKKQRIWRFLILGSLVFGGVLIWSIKPRRLPLFLFNLSGIGLIYLLLFLWIWRSQERDTRLLLAFQRSLELGVTPKPQPPRRLVIPFWISIPLAVFLLILCIGNRFFSQLYPITAPLEGFSRPYIHLQDLESEPLVTYEKLFDETPRREQDNCFVTRSFSFLSPSYYTVNQNLFSLNAGTRENWYSITGDPACRYSPDLTAVYFHLVVPALGRTIAMSQLAQMELVNLSWIFEELSHPDLDFAVVARAEDFPEWQMAAAGRGGNVVVLRYGGREDLAEHLDVLAAALE